METVTVQKAHLSGITQVRFGFSTVTVNLIGVL